MPKFNLDLFKAVFKYERVSLVALFGAELAKSKIDKIFKKESKKIQDKLVFLRVGLPHNTTIEMGLWMYELSQYTELKEVKNAEEFSSKIKSRSFPKEFLDKYDKFIQKHGIRGYRDLDLASPRYYEDPETLWKQLYDMSKNTDPRNNPITIYNDSIKKREKTYQELYKIAAKNGKAEKFAKWYELYTNFGGYRETAKYMMIVALIATKKKALNISEKFVKQKRLKNKEEIFDLTLSQIDRAEKNKKLNIQKLREKKSFGIQDMGRCKTFSEFCRFSW